MSDDTRFGLRAYVPNLREVGDVTRRDVTGGEAKGAEGERGRAKVRGRERAEPECACLRIESKRV